MDYCPKNSFNLLSNLTKFYSYSMNYGKYMLNLKNNKNLTKKMQLFTIYLYWCYMIV